MISPSHRLIARALGYKAEDVIAATKRRKSAPSPTYTEEQGMMARALGLDPRVVAREARRHPVALAGVAEIEVPTGDGASKPPPKGPRDPFYSLDDDLDADDLETNEDADVDADEEIDADEDDVTSRKGFGPNGDYDDGQNDLSPPPDDPSGAAPATSPPGAYDPRGGLYGPNQGPRAFAARMLMKEKKDLAIFERGIFPARRGSR